MLFGGQHHWRGIVGYTLNGADGSSHALLDDANNDVTLRTYDGSEFLYTPPFNRPFDIFYQMINGPEPSPSTLPNTPYVSTPTPGLGAVGSRLPGIISSPGGVSYCYPPSSGSAYTNNCPNVTGVPAEAEIISDTSGNHITIASPYWAHDNFAQTFDYSTQIVDSVGRTFSSPPSVTSPAVSACPSITNPDGSVTPPESSSVWSVPGPSGQVSYTFCFITIPINTNFSFLAINQDNQQYQYPVCLPGSKQDNQNQCIENFQQTDFPQQVIQSVVLPNGTYWGFSYNPSAAYNSGDTGQYGDIWQIVLPSGGAIQYSYLAQNPSTLIANRYIAARTTVPAAGTGGSNATWSYSWSPAQYFAGGGCNVAGNSYVLDPLGALTTYSYTYNQYNPNGNSGALCHPLTTTVTTTGNGDSESTVTTNNLFAIGSQQPDTDIPPNGNNPPQATVIWVPGTTPYAGMYVAVLSLPSTVTTTITSGGSSYSATTAYSYDNAGVPASPPACSQTTFVPDPTEPNTGIWVPDPCDAYGTTMPQATSSAIPLGSQTAVVTTGTNGQTLQSLSTSYLWQQNSSYYQANLLALPSQKTSYSGSSIASQTSYTYDETTYSQAGLGALTTVSKVNTLGPSAFTHFYYGSNGMAFQTEDPNGNLTRVSNFDCNGLFPLTTIQAYGTALASKSRVLHDCNTGIAIQSQSPNDIAASRPGTLTTIDVAGNPTLITYPDGGTTTISYNNYAVPLQITKSVSDKSAAGSAFSIVSSTYNDSFGRVAKTIDPSRAEVDRSYDGVGNVIAVSNPYIYQTDPTYGITSFAYDLLRRKRLQCNPDNQNVSPCAAGNSYQQTTYSGNQISFKDENGNVWTRTIDPFGRLTNVVEPGGAQTSYSYDVLGNLVCADQWGVSSAGTPCSSDHARSFTYDQLSRLITSTNPETGTICYGQWSSGKCQGGYDPNGNLLYKTDAGGVVVAYSYDALNRVTQKLIPVAGTSPTQYTSACYQYGTSAGSFTPTNLIGHLLAEWTQPGTQCASAYSPSIGALTAKLFLSYDPMGRLLQSQQCVKSMCTNQQPFSQSQTYDLAGNMTSWQDGRGYMTLTQQIDTSGRPIALNNNVSLGDSPYAILSVQGYSPSGSLQNWNVGNFLDFSRTFDNRLRVTGETVTH